MTPGFVDVTFRTRYRTDSDDCVLAVTGSSAFLGAWDPSVSVLLEPSGQGDWWDATVPLPLAECLEYKLFVWNRRLRHVVRWEERENRIQWIDRGPIVVMAFWNNDSYVKCKKEVCKVSHCECQLPITPTGGDKNTVIIKIVSKYCLEDTSHCLALVGSGVHLGNWNPSLAIQFTQTLFQSQELLCVTFSFPKGAVAEWKLVVLNKTTRKPFKWEERHNRLLSVEPNNCRKRQLICMYAMWNVDAVLAGTRCSCSDEFPQIPTIGDGASAIDKTSAHTTCNTSHIYMYMLSHILDENMPGTGVRKHRKNKTRKIVRFIETPIRYVY